MAEAGFVLSEGDRDTLRDFIRQTQLEAAQQERSQRPEHKYTQEVYIAKIPGGGLPARSGTTPGSANCTIYRIVDGPSIKVAGTSLTKKVYNLSTTAIAADSYIAIKRDAWGNWLADFFNSGSALSDFCIVTLDSPPVTITTPGDFLVWDSSSERNDDHDNTTNPTRITVTGGVRFMGFTLSLESTSVLEPPAVHVDIYLNGSPLVSTSDVAWLGSASAWFKEVNFWHSQAGLSNGDYFELFLVTFAVDIDVTGGYWAEYQIFP